METLNKEHKLCMSCMEEHEVETVRIQEINLFKGEEIEYYAEYEYCNITNEFTSNEDMIKKNDISFKDSYRNLVGLLTSKDISKLREKYGISQTDLSILLGLGGKTITRYESTQVQDKAYDVLLRKLNNDPEWFIELLNNSKNKLSETAFQKYYHRAMELYYENEDDYKRKSILALYANICNLDDCCGNTHLNLDKVTEVICYFANSIIVSALYKVKLMKMLWYADTLSYKRHGHSITGLAYKTLPMGAVPIGHELIIELKGINYEEIDFGDGVGYHFKANSDFKFKLLDENDKSVLDTIASRFGSYSKNSIIEIMHNERAYTETAERDIIQFQYAKYLSID